MSWWRNEDSRDDDNELEIKLILAIPVVIAMGVGLVLLLVGCSYKGQARDASYRIDCSKCEVQIEFTKSHKARQLKKD